MRKVAIERNLVRKIPSNILLDMRLNKHMNFKEIAERFNYSKTSSGAQCIIREFKRRGLALQTHTAIKDISDEVLIEMYWIQNMSFQEVAEKLGYKSAPTIVREFKRRGFSYRDYREAGKLMAACGRIRIGGRCRENHPQWKGGRAIRKDGYVLIFPPNDYKGILQKDSYVFEHRLIWEQTHGRLLKQGEIIHHLNGIRGDNRPENLAVTTNNKHERWTLVKQLQKRIRELEQLHLAI